MRLHGDSPVRIIPSAGVVVERRSVKLAASRRVHRLFERGGEDDLALFFAVISVVGWYYGTTVVSTVMDVWTVISVWYGFDCEPYSGGS